MEAKKRGKGSARAQAESKPAAIRELSHDEAAQISGGVHWADRILGEFMDDVTKEGLRTHKEK